MDTRDEAFCNHCDTRICKKTYLVHLGLYYDGKWTKTMQTADDGEHNPGSQYNNANTSTVLIY